MPKSKDYSGILAEPIRLSPGLVGHLANDAKIVEEQARRLCALFDHYGISLGEPGSHLRLILAMAQSHVPGFKVLHPADERRAKGGRPMDWDLAAQAKLLRDVQELVSKGMTARSACKALRHKRGPARYTKATLDSLYRRYQRAKQTLSALRKHLLAGSGE